MLDKFFDVYSTERSGHHSVMFWLMHQYQNVHYCLPTIDNRGVELVSYDNYQAILFDNLDYDEKYLDRGILSTLSINKQYLYMIILAYERGYIDHINWTHFKDVNKIVEQNFTVENIIILRDLKNTIASFMANGNGVMPNDYGRIQIWKDRAKTIINKQQKFKFINFNLYNSSKDYRQQICQGLGLYFTDIGIDYVTPHGGGSSFTQQHALNRTQLNQRFLQYQNDPTFQQYLKKYDDCLQLSNKIFGEI